MIVACIITACRGREANLEAVITSLERQSRAPDLIVLVEDGGRLDDTVRAQLNTAGVIRHWGEKHEPGQEQPRNVGTRIALGARPDVTHAWFLDSDVIVDPGALEELELRAAKCAEPAVVVAPYDWLPPGTRAVDPTLHNDPRWAIFNQRADETIRDDLSAGLACFSGNLLWPVGEFCRVGGFWSELHHGRCEDGELGIRAVAMGVPIVLAPYARGWHLWHPINEQLALERNRRDVPMLNARHPWMQGRGVFMVDRDGKAFDVRCACGRVVPTIGWWDHAETCGKGMTL